MSDSLNPNPINNDNSIQNTMETLVHSGLTPEQAMQSSKEIVKLNKQIEHEKKGLDFSILLVRNLLFFLLVVCACKVILDIDKKEIDLNEYFSLLIPIITTALGYILGKKND